VERRGGKYDIEIIYGTTDFTDFRRLKGKKIMDLDFKKE
jgi:hypothetical protein